jgi:monooxygenase
MIEIIIHGGRRWERADMTGETRSVDVLIVGAGLSGIGAAFHLQRRCPGKSYLILEARDRIGGTWDLFRFPGVRSDSDMYTLGYTFRPWPGARSIAGGSDIRGYIEDTARESFIDDHIRFNLRVSGASWCSDSARWTITVLPAGSEVPILYSCRFLYLCSGYYSYGSAHRPSFPGENSYRGTLVHPQFWPEDLEYAGKQVVVIGSGATAVTMIPAMARSAAHVTMLQRSPSYVFSLPTQDAVVRSLRRWFPARIANRLARMKNVVVSTAFFQLARRRPRFAAKHLIAMAQKQLPPGFDIARHFTPRYNPWDQRVCVVPDGDLFKAIRAGTVSVVTDAIESFTADGIDLKSGTHLRADVVVAATGLKLNQLGDIDIEVDGVRTDLSRSMSYRGIMFSGIPNLAYAFGYTNASWTLKAELGAKYVCRLINHMDSHRNAIAVPRRDPSVSEQPLIDFTSGYVVRSRDALPKQGSRRPWKLYQNYFLDALALRFGRIDDGVLEFARPGAA